MRLLLITLLFSASASVLADKNIKVNVLRNDYGDGSLMYSAKFDLDSSDFQLTTIWRSPGGIKCDLIITDGKKQIGAFTCQSPDRYKAQTTFNCFKNVSKKESAYLYFAHGSDIKEMGNFYIWCERTT